MECTFWLLNSEISNLKLTFFKNAFFFKIETSEKLI